MHLLVKPPFSKVVAKSLPILLLFFCRKRPNLLEFFSYVLHFSMLLVGPTCTYFEFMEFIDGTNMKVPLISLSTTVPDGYFIVQCYCIIGLAV